MTDSIFTNTPATTSRLLRIRDVMQKTGFSRSHIYALASQGTMPAPIRIGGVSAWLESEVDAFIVNAVSASRAAA